ncbi:MAG: Na+/H+ antiporter NhaA [Gloeobacteraceae cyanobacterium ES-bin-144]|nr:Na+/H+ antiporter NhaA [Verrucomicrobiales bacterium]
MRPFLRFLKLETSSGILLMAFAVIAIVWANSGWSGVYESVFSTKFTIGYGDAMLSKPLVLWINDGLMAVFFLVVGIEIKRELMTGELNNSRKATLPAAAALGGMLVPALLFTLFNKGLPSQAGWGVPMATDIAFSLGVLAMLGKRIPLALKILLTAVAIVDDLGAVIVIAVFYTATIKGALLASSLGLIGLAWMFGRVGGRSVIVFTLLGVIAWVFMLKSGVHATIAGVLLAFALPTRQLAHEAEPLGQRLEHALHPWVAFVIMPIFALANAGVVVSGSFTEALAKPPSLGIITGLVLGKPIGIFGFAWLAVKLGIATLPAGLTWGKIFGMSLLAGIGFTMSLFIADLAFGTSENLTYAKAGILAGSLISGILGYLYLRFTTHKAEPSI